MGATKRSQTLSQSVVAAPLWVRRRPNIAWSRRPPLRFNEVALPAKVSVIQACPARGGGWARLTLTVGRLHAVETSYPAQPGGSARPADAD